MEWNCANRMGELTSCMGLSFSKSELVLATKYYFEGASIAKHLIEILI